MKFFLPHPPWALGSGSDQRSHPTSSAGSECLAAGRGCQSAGCRAGVRGRRWKRAERRIVGLEHPRAGGAMDGEAASQHGHLSTLL